MIASLFIAASAAAVLAGNFVVDVAHAIEGYEDEYGFHFERKRNRCRLQSESKALGDRAGKAEASNAEIPAPS